MFCSTCGKRHENNGSFCTHCGTKISATAEPIMSAPAQASKHSKRKKAIALAISGTAALIVIAIVLIMNNSGDGRVSDNMQNGHEREAREYSDNSLNKPEDLLPSDLHDPVAPSTPPSQPIPLPQVTFDSIPAISSNASERWEYLTISTIEQWINEELNELAYEGWEPILFSSAGTSNTLYVILRRSIS